MAQTLAMPLAPSLSVIYNGGNRNSLSRSLSFPIASPPKVGEVRFLYFISILWGFCFCFTCLEHMSLETN